MGIGPTVAACRQEAWAHHTFCAPRVGRVVARRSVAASKGDAFRTMVTERGGIGAGWLPFWYLQNCMGGLKLVGLCDASRWQPIGGVSSQR